MTDYNQHIACVNHGHETFKKGRKSVCAACGMVTPSPPKLKARAPKPFVPSEDHESIAFAAWLEMKVAQGAALKFSHIPNETPTTPIQAKRLQRMGVKRGVPDYLLIIRNRIVFIELKRTVGGRTSVQQTSWLDALTMAGVSAYVCNGAAEAKKLVSNLLDAA